MPVQAKENNIENTVVQRKPTDVIIKGKKETAKETFEQLKKSTSLTLTMDEQTGKVIATGKAKTKADKMLLKACKDKKVIVEIKATNSNFTDSGHWFAGGAYGGSEVKDGKTFTKQTVNPTMTEKIDNFYEKPIGVSVLHEVLESYIGGVNSPGIGAPTFDPESNEYKAYKKAHDETKKLDKRHPEMELVIDDKTGQIYISKPNSKGGYDDTLINDLKKDK